MILLKSRIRLEKETSFVELLVLHLLVMKTVLGKADFLVFLYFILMIIIDFRDSQGMSKDFAFVDRVKEKLNNSEYQEFFEIHDYG